VLAVHVSHDSREEGLHLGSQCPVV
jgi:hypothetical protein